ncbi:MAG: helix-turn-helix domain-containing protein [Candidatus Lokiarchaeota archaeon]|nr:helix-turn-helix domain-containing protein [Candidatus Lokiarchaeota archaeon]
MSVNEVAEFFKVNTVTVRRQTKRGELPGFKIGNQWRFRESDIQKFIDNQVSQKLFAMKAKNLWDDIQNEVEQSEYTAEDVPELVRQVREKYRN